MKFIKIKIFGLILLAAAVLLVQPFAGQAEVSQATRNYLHSQGLSDWVVMGLAAAGEQNFDLGYLVQANPQSATDYSRSILAITAANQDPTATANRDWVAGLRNFFQNNQFGSNQSISDDMWAIMALRSAGVAGNEGQVVAAKNFVLANQNQDGGWSYQASRPSDTNDTAAAIMALRAAGLPADDQALSAAVNFLHQRQGQTGGFSMEANDPADGASTAWVIAALTALGQDQNNWAVGGHTPVSFLQSLVLPNGSYRWQAEDGEGDIITTAYAAVALSNAFYPVRVRQEIGQPDPVLPQVSLRIEGPENTLCQVMVSATSVLGALLAGTEPCRYTLQVDRQELGVYVSRINQYQAGPSGGWSYRVNWQFSRLPVDQQPVQANDQVLWFFGDGRDQPLRLTLDRTNGNVGETVVALAEAFDGQAWQVASGTRVMFGNQVVIANGQGQARWVAQNVGSIAVVGEAEGRVRSQRQTLVIGQVGNGSISQTINLQVDVVAPVGGGNIAFQVAQADLGFGSLRAGQSERKATTVTNLGGTTIRLTAQLSGDPFFANTLTLNDQALGNWFLDIGPNQTVTVMVGLTIPANSLERGRKSGQLIYWAQAR